jgi:hypothetical protein
MLPERIIERDSLALRPGTARVSLRMPWYRALPLSSVADIHWTIDGLEVDRDSITWTTDGVTRALHELPPLSDEWWYVLDSAVVEGAVPELEPRDEHTVAVALKLFIPYITTDFGVLQIEELDSKMMPAAVLA